MKKILSHSFSQKFCSLQKLSLLKVEEVIYTMTHVCYMGKLLESCPVKWTFELTLYNNVAGQQDHL